MPRKVPKVNAGNPSVVPAKPEKTHAEWKMQRMIARVTGDEANGPMSVRALLRKGTRNDQTELWELMDDDLNGSSTIIEIPDVLEAANTVPAIGKVLTDLYNVMVAYAATLPENPLDK
jgi:hypothetical protein